MPMRPAPSISFRFMIYTTIWTVTEPPLSQQFGEADFRISPLLRPLPTLSKHLLSKVRVEHSSSSHVVTFFAFSSEFCR